MRSAFLWAAAALLLAIPFSAGHASGPLAGVPKTYCEDHLGDTNVHEYGPPLLWLPPSLPRPPRAFDGSLGDCDGDGIPGDPDGHAEYSASEVRLASAYPWFGCPTETPHHPVNPTVHATDATGAPVRFSVYTAGGAHPLFPCEESPVLQDWRDCFGSCYVPFPPGGDGLYRVYLAPLDVPPPFAGHVWTT